MMSRLSYPEAAAYQQIPKRETMPRSISNSTRCPFGELRINSVEVDLCPFLSPAFISGQLQITLSLFSLGPITKTCRHILPGWLGTVLSLVALSSKRCLISSRGNASSSHHWPRTDRCKNDNLPIWPILHTGDGHPLISSPLFLPAQRCSEGRTRRLY